MPARRLLLGAAALLLMFQILATARTAGAGPGGEVLFTQGDNGDNAFWTSTHYVNGAQAATGVEDGHPVGPGQFELPLGERAIVAPGGSNGWTGVTPLT